MNNCVICKGPIIDSNDSITCSTVCHEILVKFLEMVFGTAKKVIDMNTNLEYRIPTRDIIEKGLNHDDLTKYPLWDDHQI